MGTNAQTMFCLPKFEVKFETKNGAISMFRADKVLHCIMEKPRRESIRYGIFPKTLCTKSFEKFKRIIIIIIESN
jgi:hypothetical protein